MRLSIISKLTQTCTRKSQSQKHRTKQVPRQLALLTSRGLSLHSRTGWFTVQRAHRPCASLCHDEPRCRAVRRVGLAALGAESQKASESEALILQLVAGQLAMSNEMREMREVVQKMGGDLRTEMRVMGTEIRKELGGGIRKELGWLDDCTKPRIAL